MTIRGAGIGLYLGLYRVGGIISGPSTVSNLLLEDGFNLLLETSGVLLLEA